MSSFLGRYGHISRPSAGAPDNNAINMAQHRLRMHLRAALEEATREKKAVVREGVHVKTRGSYQTVRLKIHPVTRHGDMTEYLIIIFEAAHRAADIAHKPQESTKRPVRTPKQLYRRRKKNR
jgi:hypothetical protein